MKSEEKALRASDCLDEPQSRTKHPHNSKRLPSLLSRPRKALTRNIIPIKASLLCCKAIISWHAPVGSRCIQLSKCLPRCCCREAAQPSAPCSGPDPEATRREPE